MEKYIVGGNCTGKTKKLLEATWMDGATVVCKHPTHMEEKAKIYGFYGLKFIGYDEFFRCNLYGLQDKKVVIDEIGDFFKSYFNVELDGFTMTVDKEESEETT